MHSIERRMPSSYLLIAAAAALAVANAGDVVETFALANDNIILATLDEGGGGFGPTGGALDASTGEIRWWADAHYQGSQEARNGVSVSFG